MKKMTCAMVGGPADCTYEMSGNTAEELVNSGMDHVKEAHPELAQQIATTTPEDMAKWSADFQAKFDAQPEEASPEAAMM